MKISELVKKLLENGANADAVAVALQAVEEITLQLQAARDAAEEAQPKRRKHRPRSRPELAAVS